jgi:radical SAM superfamily enzyme YgiQ (UPF0313 family)
MIMAQVDSLRHVDFKLIYLGDSTFGQSENYKLVKEIYERITMFNPEFKGFIIQTTASQLNKKGFIEELNELPIEFVEIGVESFNDDLLKANNKPATTTTIEYAVKSLAKYGIKTILNLIIGLPNETTESYSRTLKFVKNNTQCISHLNIYNLALYSDTTLSEEIKSKDQEDVSEFNINKTFHSECQKFANMLFFNAIFDLGNKLLDKHV